VSYTNTFGAQPVAPANPSYEALVISADQALVWPLETTGGVPYVAAQIDVTASTAGLRVLMPSANTGSTGVACTIANLGANTFTVTDQSGNAIASIAPTQAWQIVLTNNTTANGTWRALQLASTTSSATAASLAGPGLQAVGPLLETVWNTSILPASASITNPQRATLFIYQGSAAAAWQLDTSANLTSGWFCGYANQGTGALTISTSGGDTINGAGSLTVAPGQSGVIVCTAGGFNVFAGLVGLLPIAAGGTGAGTALNALTNLGGTSLGTSIFTAPNVATVIALLGLNNFTFQESTVSTNQTLASTSSNTIYVSTAALTINIPLTSTLTKQFVFAVYAEGGVVTVTPQASDAINGGTAGTSFIVNQGASVLFATDANGNWWPILTSPAALKETTVSTNQNAAAGAVYVATAALTVTLPLTSTVSSTYVSAAYAAGGSVTFTPQAGDAINGQSTGANYILAQGNSLLMTTDGAGNWWPIFNKTSAVPGNQAVFKPTGATVNGSAVTWTNGGVPTWIPSGALCKARVWGGAGGGGGGSAPTNQGAGGGGGAYLESPFTWNGQTVTVGVGGSGGNGTGPTNGADGADSAISGVATAGSGKGGGASPGGGGTGGSPTGGSFSLRGGAGTNGVTYSSGLGQGRGGAAFGCGIGVDFVVAGASAGRTGGFPGQGGNGGVGSAGGAGADGIIIIEW
jgi:hypothetical protein